MQDGWLSPAELCAVLRRHTAEAIERMSARSELQTTWYPHRKNHYDARFTFDPTEMLAEIGARVFVDEAREAEACFAAIVPEGAIAFAFMRRSGLSLPLPIAMRMNGDRSGVDAREVGGWAATFLDLVGYIDATSSLAAAVGPRGQNVVTWRDGALLYVAVCPDSPSMARLIRNRRATQIR